MEDEGAERARKLLRRLIGGIGVAEQRRQERHEAGGEHLLQDGQVLRFERRHVNSISGIGFQMRASYLQVRLRRRS